MRAIGYSPQNLEHQSRDEDSACSGTSPKQLHQANKKTLNLDKFIVHQPSQNGGSSAALGFEPPIRWARVHDHNH
ncbi:hypothetical protein TNCV_1018551 [Trichonephila clavipes]|nr:hypothetical protein TNCV_1018551 [Trichonephila clavipes]